MPNPMQKPMPSEAPDMGGDPEAVLEAPEESAGAGYRIATDVYPDGTFAVSKQPLPAEQPEMGEDAMPVDGDEPAGSGPITNFDDTLREQVKIFKANPSDKSSTSGFKAGFAANKQEF